MKKVLSLLLALCMVIITGCGNSEGTSGDENMINVPQEDVIIAMPDKDDPEYAEYEKMTKMGKRMKELTDNEELVEAVIIVNGHEITRREFEAAKVYTESNFGEENVKERVNGMIRDAVLETEAERLGIKGSQEEVDAYIASIKEAGFTPTIAGYIKGMEMSVDEYCKTLEEIMYKSTQRNNLWLKYKNEHIEEMMTGDVLLADTENKYRENYELQLIEKAEIEILDDEIKSLLQ